MYYLDGNAFIYPALYEGPKASRAAALLRAVVDGIESAATASPTVDGVVWIVSRHASRDVALRQGERLLQLPNLRILDVGSPERLRVIKLMRVSEHLTPHDGIHAAAMTEHAIHTIVSDDDDFDDRADISRVGLDEFEPPDPE